MNRVLSAFDSYHAEPTLQLPGKPPLQATDLIAYFCAEFGFHESLPIYSGGLGILAGDHCKGASDLRLPFVAVGLLYRQGYFHQTIDRDGNQTAHYGDNDFDDMPIEEIHARRRQRGEGRRRLPRAHGVDQDLARARRQQQPLPARHATGREQRSRPPASRTSCMAATARTRIEQEILLGVGGVRALAALGLQPTVWHINEGHAAFLVLERIRRLMADQGMRFAAALEAAAANTVFTTHTPVPAGHDHFADDMVMHYFGEFCKTAGLDRDGLLAMGRVGGGVGSGGEFNMTALALRGSRFHNGVSRIHGEVSSRICSDMWPQLDPGREPDGLRHQCGARADLPRHRLVRDLRPPSRPRLAAPPHRPELLGQRTAHSGPDLLEHPPVAQGPVAAPGAQPGTPAASAQPGFGGAPGSRPALRRPDQSDGADHRLRPALRHLQARRTAVQQSRLAARDHFRRTNARCCSSLPARRTRPTNRGGT